MTTAKAKQWKGTQKHPRGMGTLSWPGSRDMNSLLGSANN